MTTLKGNCQRCGNYDSYLTKVESKWLCRRCRDEQKKFAKPRIPLWRAINPFKKLKRKLLSLKNR